MFESRSSEVRQRSVSTNTDYTPEQESAFISDTYDIMEEFSDTTRKSKGFTSETEKEVFEIQLLQLQEQLESAMIEKEQMANKLKKYAEPAFKKLQHELEAERRKNKDLQLMISSKRNSKSRLDSSSDSTSTSDLQRMGSDRRGSRKEDNKEKSWNFPNRIMERVLRSVYDITDDFSTEPIKDQEDLENDGKVNVAIIMDIITLFMYKIIFNTSGDAIKPYINTIKGIQDLLRWQNSAYTLIVFMVYMYAVWMGCAMQVFLLCLIFRHFICYLQIIGIHVKFNFFHHEEQTTSKKEEESLGLSDKINLVVQIAKKVQDFLGKAADSFEKIESVLTWRHRPAARRVFLTLCGALVMSIVMDFNLLVILLGLNMGIKLFIVDYVYYKFPRVKRKYDSVYKLWQTLPNRAQWEKTQIESHIDNYVLPRANSASSTEEEKEKSVFGSDKFENSMEAELTDEDKEFCQLFCLPLSEVPLSGWDGGRRCTLVNREKKVLGDFKNGKLYLTKSFLCFERKRSPSKENLLIPLIEILAVNKAKPFKIMLGTGMAIEVILKGKRFVFGGLLNRDDTFDKILEHGINNELPWATGISLDDVPSPRPKVVRLTENKQNFSFPDEYDETYSSSSSM
ncbi:GRAM domain-containing protein 4-like [Crassostrea virginica]